MAKSLRTAYNAIVLTATSLIFSGCSSTMPSTTPPATVGCKTFNTQEGTPQLSGLSVLSSDLAKMIGVSEYFLNRTPLGMASATASVYNCTEQDVVLLFRARFSGDRGETETPSAWRTVFLPPRGTVSYGEASLTSTTTRVSIDIVDGNRGQSQFAPGQNFVVPRNDVKQGAPQ